jgi:hypothetical protein
MNHLILYKYFPWKKRRIEEVFECWIPLSSEVEPYPNFQSLEYKAAKSYMLSIWSHHYEDKKHVGINNTVFFDEIGTSEEMEWYITGWVDHIIPSNKALMYMVEKNYVASVREYIKTHKMDKIGHTVIGEIRTIDMYNLIFNELRIEYKGTYPDPCFDLFITKEHEDVIRKLFFEKGAEPECKLRIPLVEELYDHIPHLPGRYPYGLDVSTDLYIIRNLSKVGREWLIYFILGPIRSGKHVRFIELMERKYRDLVKWMLGEPEVRNRVDLMDMFVDLYGVKGIELLHLRNMDEKFDIFDRYGCDPKSLTDSDLKTVCDSGFGPR